MFKSIKNSISIVKTKYVRILRNAIENRFNARWNNYPFGNKPRVPREYYLKLASDAIAKNYEEIDQFEKKTGFAIKQDWLNELALHTQICVKKSPICYAHGRVLYSALSNYLAKSRVVSSADKVTIWETGTARGFSSLCMAKALNDNNQPGVILTFDRLPHKTPMFWNCIDDHEGPKTRLELLKPWEDLVQRYIIYHQGDTQIEMSKVHSKRINFAFLDGAHTYDDVWFEFEQISNSQLAGDSIVYDDYTPNQYPGLTVAVDEICLQHNYSRTDLKAHSGRGYVVAIKE